MLPTATDGPAEVLPPGSGLWWVTHLIALSTRDNNALGPDVMLGEITETDDLRIEALVRRFLRNMLDRSEYAVLDTLSESMRDYLGEQAPMPAKGYFKLHFPNLGNKAHIVLLSEYALAAQGLFALVTLIYHEQDPVRMYFFFEQDPNGDWLISEVQPGP
jgi:hypothetical protein